MTEKDKRRLTALDQGFKAVVHDSDVLSWLIRSNVDEFADKSIDEIKSCLKIGEDGHTVIGNKTEFDSLGQGKIVTDSVFDLKIPGTDEKVSVILNIEGQSDPNPGYPIGKRAEYYLSRLVSSQKGIDFTNDDYGKLRKVYCLWYMLRPGAKDGNTAIAYGMCPKKVVGNPADAPVLDTFNIVMINVGRYDSSLPDVSAFPAALFSEMDMSERQELMSQRFNITLSDILLKEVDGMFSLGEDTYRHGLRVGREEGRAEGVAEGIAETKADLVIRLVRDKGWLLEDAFSFAEVPEDLRKTVDRMVKKGLN